MTPTQSVVLARAEGCGECTQSSHSDGWCDDDVMNFYWRRSYKVGSMEGLCLESDETVPRHSIYPCEVPLLTP